MAEEQQVMAGSGSGPQRAGGFLGSLKDALAAASRDETGQAQASPVKPASNVIIAGALPPPIPAEAAADAAAGAKKDLVPSAAEAAREARGHGNPIGGRLLDLDSPPTTRVVRAAVKSAEGPARTQLVRGKVNVKRGAFDSDPVVGWLVIVGGPGIGQFRPIFEGNNTIGRAASNRISLDFGDDAISAEEQAYIRYDSAERTFLFVPNLAKTNVVSLNDKRPTGATDLSQMDVITMGRTQLVFVPFCGADFDWSAIAEA